MEEVHKVDKVERVVLNDRISQKNHVIRSLFFQLTFIHNNGIYT